MLWPLILPAQITFWLLLAVVASLTALAPRVNWKRGHAFNISLVVALLAFVPSCTGVMTILDAQRFGIFQYSSFTDIHDLRIQRFLPTQAQSIELEKYAWGHRAKYSITQSELTQILDGLWHKYGPSSATPRDKLDDGKTVTDESFKHVFHGLDWLLPPEAIEFRSPVERDGGGATYFFDPKTETAYHRAGYW